MATPQLYYQPGGIAERVMRRCPELQLPFNPTAFARDPHSQSGLGMLRTLTARGSYTRQLVMTSDHGTLGLDWWCGSDKATWAAGDAPIVLFIHGINGGSHEGYVKWACVAAASRGWRAVVLNMRGCNGLPLTSARGYNAINTADVHVAVQSIHSRFPSAPLMAAGYSLGSVLLAKYVAEADNGLYQHANQQQQQPSGQANAAARSGTTTTTSGSSGGGSVPEPSRGSGFVAVALVSPPVCLHTTNAKMGRPTSAKFLYNLAVAYKLREYVREHLPSIQAAGMSVDVDAMLSGWTVASFDDVVTLKALGYPSPHLYYRHACSTNYIPHIRTPTLIMLSKDDPFLGVLPQEQVAANPFTLMAATKRGGHLGFLQGWWPLGASYCDTVIDGWMGAALQEWRRGVGVVPGGDAGDGSSSDWQAQAPLPSWGERAVAAGLLDGRQAFDPTTLAGVLCSCSPDEHPVAQAHAVDTALNAATAPVAAAAGVASKAAATGGSSSAKHLWSFGFGRPAASAAGSSAAGLRQSGAWAPFGDDDGGKDATTLLQRAGSRLGWWGGRGSGAAAPAASDAASRRINSNGSSNNSGGVSYPEGGDSVLVTAPAGGGGGLLSKL